MPLDVPLTVRDLSQGGFSAESARPFPPGSRHHFRFTTPDHTEVALEATAVHCRLASAGGDGEVTYITGFEFVSDDASDRAIASLMSTLAAVLASE